MKRAGDIAKDATVKIRSVDTPKIYEYGAPPRKLPVKTLHDLSVKHLRGSHLDRFRELRQAAYEWIKLRPNDPGISFVITGSVGTGKTTIIQNLRASAQTEYLVLDDEGEPLGEPFRSVNSRFYTATDFMALMDPGRRLAGAGSTELLGRKPLYKLFQGIEVIALDDLGTEELSFVPRDLIDLARQNRYREAFDYFYDNGVSVLITSMVPLLHGGHPNQDFVDIIGAASFDRLFERAKGFMFDLTGLPSYRQITSE
ncbi:hypothetical protein LCGC14_2363160 [marine sediment metagenome]|uniref:AAA+ ATPase domain-containing protein n=1 Tax=marine sediment metagenome TaxID=412755 RepID=A0A0F9CTF0_9ZZZZ